MSSSNLLLKFLLLLIVLLLCVIATIFFVTRALDSAEADEGELLSLQIIFRHDILTPLIFKPLLQHYDVRGGSSSGLIKEDKRHLKIMGRALKRKYRKYFEHLNATDIIIESSPTPRCINSTLIFLSSLLPQRLTAQRPLQVKVNPKETAWMLYPDAPCPRALQLAAQSRLKSQSILNRIQALWKDPQTVNWSELLSIYNLVNNEKRSLGDSFSRPQWLTELGDYSMEHLKQLWSWVFNAFNYKPEYTRLRVGVLLGRIVENMVKVLEQNGSTPKKLHLFATHNSMLSMILHALQQYDHYPADALIFELRNGTEPQVWLRFLNATDQSISPMVLNSPKRFATHCNRTTSCRFEAFEKALAPFLVYDIQKECQV